MIDNKDKQYVEKLLKGDEKAYAHLFEKYSGKVYHVSIKMGLSHEKAEGIVQAVFLKIWKNRERLNADLSFNAYVLTIAKSVVIKSLRKKALEVAYIDYKIDLTGFKSSNTEEEILFEDMMAISSGYLNKLPEKQRQVFIMKNHENMSSDQIAKKLNLSKRTIENQVYRATKNLKDQLTKLDIISLLFFLTYF